MVLYGKRDYKLPEITLQSAATGGNGTVCNLGSGFSRFAMEVVKNTATTRGCSISLQGSISGGSSSWTTLKIWASSSGKTSGDIIGFSSGAYTRVRASIVTMSSSESVTVYLAASQ